MEGHDNLDSLDRHILRILSFYEALDLLQLWYEIGESDGSVMRMTQEELSRSLESFRARGFVESVGEGEGGIRWIVTPKGKAEPYKFEFLSTESG